MPNYSIDRHLKESSERAIQQLQWSSPLVWLIVAIIPTVFTVIWWGNGLRDFVWDAAWYQSVASNGYQFDGNILRQQNIAFLPGYPLAIAVLHFILGIDNARSGYFVSMACYVSGCLCLYQVLCTWCTWRQSLTAVLIFSVNPFAIYLFNGYSEPLFFLLSSIFFLGLVRKRLWMASVALSIALITRPHAIALIPVLLFVVARDHGLLKVGQDTKQAQWRRFCQVSVDQFFIVCIFPAALTCYWYLKFGDPLVYLNGLTAWSGVGTSGVQGQMLFLLDGLTHYHVIARKEFTWLSLPFLSPSNLAAINVMLNAASIVILVRKKYYELAIYCASLLVFWLVKSVPGDAGRHALMLLALPVVMSWTLFPRFSESKLHEPRPLVQRIVVEGMKLVVIGYLLFALCHFCAYAYLQMRGGWIS